MILITGDAGVGKTTAVRFWISSLRDECFTKVYIPLATVGVTDFYRQINKMLNGEYSAVKSRLFKAIQDRILELAVNQNKVPVIVIDECQFLKNENLYTFTDVISRIIWLECA